MMILLLHAGRAIEPHDLWEAWAFEPGVVISLGIAAGLYAAGFRKMQSRATNSAHVAFAVGWISLAIALVSPLHPLGSALFSAHMVQHEILMMIAAPLLVWSRPLAVFLWGSVACAADAVAIDRTPARTRTFIDLDMT